MNRFAALLDALLFTPSRNGKLRLMREYFATTPDPERGWALTALTGELSFAEAKPSQVWRLPAQHHPTFGALRFSRPSRPVPLLIHSAGARAWRRPTAKHSGPVPRANGL